jgi:hypothetical protein
MLHTLQSTRCGSIKVSREATKATGLIAAVISYVLPAAAPLQQGAAAI